MVIEIHKESECCFYQLANHRKTNLFLNIIHVRCLQLCLSYFTKVACYKKLGAIRFLNLLYPSLADTFLPFVWRRQENSFNGQYLNADNSFISLLLTCFKCISVPISKMYKNNTLIALILFCFFHSSELHRQILRILD